MRIARSTLSEVAFGEDAITDVNELMMAARGICFMDLDILDIQFASFELVDKIHNVAAGVIRYNQESGLSFTPAAERVDI